MDENQLAEEVAVADELLEEIADSQLKRARATSREFAKLTIKTYGRKNGVCVIPNFQLEQIAMSFMIAQTKIAWDVVEGMLKLLKEEGWLTDEDERMLLQRFAKFDRRMRAHHELFELAHKRYLDQSTKRKTYTYKASLEDANEAQKAIPPDEFDRDFQRINRNYTNWRKRLITKPSG